MSVRDLHGLAGRLQRGFEENSLTPAQDWLLGACYSELGYRHRRQPDMWRRCWCSFCRPLDEWS